jgi:hypothetical protein
LPLVFTVATDVLSLDQVPPFVASDKWILLATQTVPGPEIAATVCAAFTVTTMVAVLVPQPLLIV